MKNLLLICLNKIKYIIIVLILLLSFLVYYNFFYYTKEMRMEQYEKTIKKYLEKDSENLNLKVGR